MPPETPVAAIAHVIQLAIAPVFLISGVATLLSVLVNRLGRIVDRARVVEAKLDFHDGAQRAKASEELIRLSTRARLVNFAITFCTVSALLTCITIATLFTGTFLRFSLSKLITVLFIAAMLKSVVHRLGLSPTINDFDVREIPPLKHAEALDLLQRLAADNQVPLDEPGCHHILKLLGANWPILLQLFVSEIQDEALAKSPSSKELDQLYRERLVGGSRNKYCDNMFERLKEIFSESECRLAREILRTLCLASRPFSREDLERLHARLIPQDAHRSLLAHELDYVIDALKHDGYLLQASGGAQRTGFASHILRDYWLRKTC